MRRLPIYFLIDTSESMVGEQIQLVEEGFGAIIKELKTDPYALETVWISIIVFAGQAKTIVPLQELVTFYPPRLPIGSGTSLSKGLGHLMFELRRNIVKTTTEQKGDWKPIIFLFTDGVPTDDTQQAIAEWKQHWQRAANLVAISFGNEADTQVLSELTQHVLQFKNTTQESYREFFKWVTASIKTSSISVENNASGFEMAELNEDTVLKVDPARQPAHNGHVDPNYVVLAGKCQHTKRPYLMKYRKFITPGFAGLQTLVYKLVDGFQVDHTYFELSDETGIQQKINTEELIGAPNCPCCGNQTAFALCSCKKIHCIGEEEVSTCPWCGNQGRYGMCDSGSGFDVNRTQG
jgi:uncharacterized protein YegL